MLPIVPRNGPLSGMILTGLAVAVVVPLGLLSEGFRGHFAAPLSPGLRLAFLASLLLMAAHKVESFYAGEYDVCPVYLTSGQAEWARNPRKIFFLAFVPVFVGMTLVVYLAMLGPPWHLLIVTIWLAQGAHELHHTAKSLARRRVYPGLLTSVLFVATVSFGVFPLWHDAVFGARGAIFYGYYAALPLVLLAFYAEDRRWTARTPAHVWSPSEGTVRSVPQRAHA